MLSTSIETAGFKVEFISIALLPVAARVRNVLFTYTVFWDLYDTIQRVLDDYERVFIPSGFDWLHQICLYQMHSAICALWQSGVPGFNAGEDS